MRSILPSDDESVQAVPLQSLRESGRPAVIVEGVDRGPSPAVPSERASPDIATKIAPTKWRFNELGDVEGQIEFQLCAERTPLQDTRALSKGEPDTQEPVAFRSRFFPACVSPPDPLPPSPLQTPDASEQPLQWIVGESPMVYTESAVALPGELDREASYDFEAVAAAPYVAHSPLQDNHASIEDHMMHGFMDDSILQRNQGLTVAHFIDEQLGLEGHLDVPMDSRLSFQASENGHLGSRHRPELIEKYDPRHDDPDLTLPWDGEYCESFDVQNADGYVLRGATDWEDTTRQKDHSSIEDSSCETFLSRAQEHDQVAYEESSYRNRLATGCVDSDAYCQVLPASTPAHEESQNEVPYEDSTGFSGQSHEEDDIMLEFSEGRTLLMGMGDGILAEEPERKSSTSKLRPRPYRLQFGQSVDEIEVMVGRNLGNLWRH